MPVVKTYTIGFTQSTGEKEFKVRINCDVEGTFSIKLPDDIIPVLRKDSVSAPTLTGAMSAFNAALETFKQSRSTTKKVIYYEMRITARLMSDSNDRCILTRDDISFSTGASIGLFAAVYLERTTTKPDSSLVYEYERQDSSIPAFLSHGRHGPNSHTSRPSNNLIDWSEDAEAFFRRMGLGMQSMILQLDAAFKSPQTVASFALNGNKPLIGSAE